MYWNRPKTPTKEIKQHKIKDAVKVRKSQVMYGALLVVTSDVFKLFLFLIFLAVNEANDEYPMSGRI